MAAGEPNIFRSEITLLIVREKHRLCQTAPKVIVGKRRNEIKIAVIGKNINENGF